MAYVLLFCKSKNKNNQHFIQEETTMAVTALEQYGGYDLIENLMGKNCPLSTNSGSPLTDINLIQSDTGDENKDENEAIPFQEMLKQQVISPNVQDKYKIQQANDTSSTPESIKLLQEIKGKEDPFETQDTRMYGESYSIGNNSNLSRPLKEKFDNFLILPQKNEIGIDPFNINNYFIFHSDRNESSAFSVSAQEMKEADLRQNKEFVNRNNFVFLFDTETTFQDNLMVRTVPKQIDIFGAKVFEKHNNSQNIGQSIFDVIQEPGFTDTDMSEIDIKEVLASFKSQPDHVPLENMSTSLVPEVNTFIDAGKKSIRNDISEIIDDAVTQQNIPVDNEEGFSGNFTLGQNTIHQTPDSAQIQKTRNNHIFSADTQTTAPGTQARTNDIQQNAELSFGNGTGQPFSIESRINNEIQAFHSSSTAGKEYLQNSILEQLIQKISLVNHVDRSEIKVHLTPPELGNVKIHFTEKNDEIEAKIFVENAEVRAAIENNIHRLKESVAASGLEIQKLEVFIQHDIIFKEKYSENSESKNQQYYQGKNHGVNNEGCSEQRNNISNEMKNESGRRTSNLMVDYII
ncbi:MAG: hypothetical protein B6D34_01375 [Candidatus Brocadia sp. UTAMX1]|jgi:flagellar hook-length control protein FliK|nr:MAG: hypothetical protein B6D34_01375 [Candidatus Brocadia sp. UTAMX1]